MSDLTPDVSSLEFPRHVHWPQASWDVPGVSLIVRDGDALVAALAAGWLLVPTLVGQTPSEIPPLAVTPPTPQDEAEPAPPRRSVGWPKGKPRKVVA